MYSGLKGNVSTYQLDQGQIASTVDGTIMPQQPRILAVMIGIHVTFVGPKNLPYGGLPDMFSGPGLGSFWALTADRTGPRKLQKSRTADQDCKKPQKTGPNRS